MSTTDENPAALAADEQRKWEEEYKKAKDIYTPAGTLAVLAQSESSWIRREVAKNPRTAPITLSGLAQDKDAEVRYVVARFAMLGLTDQMLLATDEIEIVRCGVAWNPLTEADVLRVIGKIDTNIRVLAGVVQNPNTPEDVLREIDPAALRAVANSGETEPDTLARLAEHKAWDIRKAVGRNTNTAPDTLKKLARDEDYHVRAAVADNPSTPEDTLRELAQDEDWEVRIEAACNPATPADVLAVLAEDEEQVVQGIAQKTLSHKPTDLNSKVAEAQAATAELNGAGEYTVMTKGR
jgi:hypothetical protein